MPDLITTLNNYQDFELAFIVANTLDTLSEDDANLVIAEIDSRKLSQNDLNSLVEDKLKTEITDHQQKVCPRCTSDKILLTKEEFHGNNKAFGLDSDKPLTSIEYKLCSVCGWNFLVDETSDEKRKRITSVFISIVIFVLMILLLTYILEWATDRWN